MADAPVPVEKHIRLSPVLAEQLHDMAEHRRLSEDMIIERALEILFSLADSLDVQEERRGWSLLSETSLRQVWDNDQDAAYDEWRALYGVPPR